MAQKYNLGDKQKADKCQGSAQCFAVTQQCFFSLPLPRIWTIGLKINVLQQEGQQLVGKQIDKNGRNCKNLMRERKKNNVDFLRW